MPGSHRIVCIKGYLCVLVRESTFSAVSIAVRTVTRLEQRTSTHSTKASTTYRVVVSLAGAQGLGPRCCGPSVPGGSSQRPQQRVSPSFRPLFSVDEFAEPHFIILSRLSTDPGVYLPWLFLMGRSTRQDGAEFTPERVNQYRARRSGDGSGARLPRTPGPGAL